MDSATTSFDKRSVRLSILGAYWAVILLAIPLWWSTTSIERLSLPDTRVHAQSGRRLHFPVNVVLDDVRLNSDTALSLQRLLRERINEESLGQDEVEPSVVSRSQAAPVNSTSYCVKLQLPHSPSVVDGRELKLAINDSHALEPQLANALTSLLAPHLPTTKLPSFDHRIAKFASRYRLAFTLLNEDAAAGKAAIGWDVEGSLSDYISPLLSDLGALHNFTVESQLRFHAPLAFEPHEVNSAETAYGLTPEDLTVFVNSAEWTLSSSVSEDPVLHFILFIPSASRRPLRILDSNNAPIASHSFLLPQWGGVVIFNPVSDVKDHFQLSMADLSPAFSTFQDQLSTLLGVPLLPPGIAQSKDTKEVVISDWQLDALIRRRARESAEGSRETLESIVKLVAQIDNMPVGRDVRGDVQNSLNALEKVFTNAWSSPRLALQHSSQALTLASRAFFNPGMLALLYFPAEHKYAVYSPLFVPVLLPLVLTAVREFREWKRLRKPVAGSSTISQS